jgi:hypothetical protein
MWSGWLTLADAIACCCALEYRKRVIGRSSIHDQLGTFQLVIQIHVKCTFSALQMFNSLRSNELKVGLELHNTHQVVGSSSSTSSDYPMRSKPVGY